MYESASFLAFSSSFSVNVYISFKIALSTSPITKFKPFDNFALLSDADDKEKIFRDIAQMHAVIIIESKIMDRIEAAGDLLEKYGGDGYSMFLRARLLWLREDNFHALALMEDYFKISVVSDDLIIAPESPLWGLSVDMQQLVLNFIGHAYKCNEVQLSSV